MKKLFIPLLIVSLFTACQTGKVTTALSEKESGDLKEALASINAAVDPSSENYEKNINSPRTWVVRGDIYQDIYRSEKQDVKQLVDEPLAEALSSYKKALELDEKDRFTNDVKVKLTLLTNDLTNQAVDAFKSENYEKALRSFENVLEINKLPIIRQDSPNTVDTIIIFNAGLAAYNAEKYENALEHFKEAAEHGYGGARTYSLMSNAYQLNKDTLGALNVLKEGFEEYPNDNQILTSMIQLYLDMDKTEEAMKYLNMAINQEPDNATYHFALGTLHEKQGNEQQAIESYENAIEIDDSYFDAYYNLGALYYNKGVEQIEVANSIPPNENERYQEELEKANVWFREALPYMERSRELDPDHRMTLESLKNLYYRLKMMDKYNEVLEVIN